MHDLEALKALAYQLRQWRSCSESSKSSLLIWKWWENLTCSERLEIVTIVDHAWIQTLLQFLFTCPTSYTWSSTKGSYIPSSFSIPNKTTSLALYLYHSKKSCDTISPAERLCTDPKSLYNIIMEKSNQGAFINKPNHEQFQYKRPLQVYYIIYVLLKTY